MSEPYQHLGWECSPYSSKTRAYLRYKQIPHEDRFPSALEMKRSIEKKIGFVIMPVVIESNGRILQDSEVIIDTLEEKFTDKTITPKTPCQSLVSKLITLNADEWMPLIAMHTRWNIPENVSFIRRDFGRNMFPFLPSVIHPFLGGTVAKKMSSYLPILGITNKTQPAIEAWLKALLAQLDLHFSEHPFLLGSKPCRGDFALFGPLYAHVRRDPGSSHFIIQHSNVDAWIDRMKHPIEGEEGAYLSNDQIPESLFPILRRIFKEQFPALRQTVQSVGEWCDENPGKTKLPRGLGEVEIQLGDIREKRKNLSFAYWKLQKVVELYQSFDDDQLKDVNHLLSLIDGEQSLEMNMKYKLIMANYRLIVDRSS